MNTAAQTGDNRLILIGVLQSRLDCGQITIPEALGRAYDAGQASVDDPPTIRARTLKQLLADAGKASKR